MKKEINTFANTGVPLDKVSTVQPLIYHQFQTVEHSDKSVSYCSDISVLLQQKALENRLGVTQVREILNSLGSGSTNPINDALQKMSDSDLMSFIKPRALQSPSELRAWHQALKLHDFNTKSAQAYVEKNQDTSMDTSTDTSNTSSNG